MPVTRLWDERPKGATVVDVVQDLQPPVGAVEPGQHRLDRFLLVACSRRGETQLVAIATKPLVMPLVVSALIQRPVRIVAAMPHSILDDGLRLADTTQTAQRRSAMLTELETKPRQQILATGKIRRSQRVRNEPRALECAPPASLRT